MKNQINEYASFWATLKFEKKDIYNNPDFQKWIQENEKHRKAFDDEMFLRTAMGQLPKFCLNNLVEETYSYVKTFKRKKYPIFKILPLIAACLLCIIYSIVSLDSITFSHTYHAQNKVQPEIILPDHSKISIDAYTQAEVTYYASTRVVKLSKGKAFFNVYSNVNQPFIIKTDHAIIKVLGTQFEVINDNNQVKINVVEGKVEVKDVNKENTFISFVAKGESLIFEPSKETIILQNINTNKIAQWQQGKYSFHQASLKEVFNEFSKHSDIQVKLDKKIAQLPISGNFDAYNIEAFLQALPLIHPLVIDKMKNTIVIRQKI